MTHIFASLAPPPAPIAAECVVIVGAEFNVCPMLFVCPPVAVFTFCSSSVANRPMIRPKQIGAKNERQNFLQILPKKGVLHTQACFRKWTAH
jgi:hypothetical protein